MTLPGAVWCGVPNDRYRGGEPEVGAVDRAAVAHVRVRVGGRVGLPGFDAALTGVGWEWRT